MSNEDARYLCVECGGFIAHARYKLGYKVCLQCGEYNAKQVKRTVVPLHKSNYLMITDLADLKGINNKGGLVK